MDKPYKFWIYDQKTNEFIGTNTTPLFHSLQTWEPTEDPKVFKLVQTKICYEDKRYKAKKRLFEYLHPEFKIIHRSPYFGTEIGVSIPILNF